MLNFLDYQGPAGPVSGGNIGAAFQLMGFGMLGILIVMLLIFLVVYLMNRAASKKPEDKKKNGG
jgi:Na+-transporting methylmalonyl-CoA/oxaloacetate decarboxylase gamma subunit